MYLSKRNHALIFGTAVHTIIRGGEGMIRMRERDRRGKERKRRRLRDRDERAGRDQEMKRTQSWVVPPGPRTQESSHCHSMKDRVPLGCLNIGTHVFVETRSRAAVVPFDF